MRKEAKGGEVGFPNATEEILTTAYPTNLGYGTVGPYRYGTDAVDSLHVICQKGLVGSTKRTVWYIGAFLLPLYLTLHGVVNTSLKCPLVAVIVMPRTEVTASRAHNNALPISPKSPTRNR